jgi:hypothetical protein
MIKAIKFEGLQHVVCQCDKCKAEKQEQDGSLINEGTKTKQEPVIGVEVKRIESGGFTGNVWWIHENLQEGVFHLYTHPQPKPEGQHALEQALTRLQKRYSELEAKVAAQSSQCANFAQSEWVGLTYEDMIEIWNNLYKERKDVIPLPTTFGKAIEAKLKEKNT